MWIKKISVLALLIAISVSSGYSQQKLQNVFRGVKNDRNISSMTMSGGFVTQMLADSTNDISSEVDDIQLFILEEADKKLESKIGKSLEQDGFEQLMMAKTTEGMSYLYGIEEEEVIKSLFGKLTTEDKTYYLFITGKVYYDDLGKLKMDDMVHRL